MTLNTLPRAPCSAQVDRASLRAHTIVYVRDEGVSGSLDEDSPSPLIDESDPDE